MFDFMLTKRPAFLYTPDLFNYRNSERGFYFDIESTPFPMAENVDDFMRIIFEFDESAYIKATDEFLTRIGNVETGRASQAVVDEISKHI